jgi:hypothetical protein
VEIWGPDHKEVMEIDKHLNEMEQREKKDKGIVSILKKEKDTHKRNSLPINLEDNKKEEKEGDKINLLKKKEKEETLSRKKSLRDIKSEKKDESGGFLNWLGKYISNSPILGPLIQGVERGSPVKDEKK